MADPGETGATAKRTSSVHTEGAELVFDVVGAGRPSLLIPGAGGEADVHARPPPLLADAFTVITYDRRGNARSSGDRDANLVMAQQGRDAVAVIRAAGYGKALVFGNSGGANIAIRVAADHPDAVEALVVHEAPAVGLLDDAEVLAFVERVHRLAEAEGAMAAMKLFAGSLVGMDFSGGRPGGLGQPKDLSFFFAKEYLGITLFQPDLAAVKAAGTPAAVLVGEKSGDAYYVRSSRKVAEGIGCPCVTVPGNHLAFLVDPEPFARALRDVLRGLVAA